MSYPVRFAVAVGIWVAVLVTGYILGVRPTVPEIVLVGVAAAASQDVLNQPERE